MYLEKIYQIITDKFDKTNLTPNTRLVDDLHLRAFDIVCLAMDIEANLNLPAYSLRVSEIEAPFMTIGVLAKKTEMIAKRVEQDKLVLEKNLLHRAKQMFLSLCK